MNTYFLHNFILLFQFSLDQNTGTTKKNETIVSTAIANTTAKAINNERLVFAFHQIIPITEPETSIRIFADDSGKGYCSGGKSKMNWKEALPKRPNGILSQNSGYAVSQ